MKCIYFIKNFKHACRELFAIFVEYEIKRGKVYSFVDNKNKWKTILQ